MLDFRPAVLTGTILFSNRREPYSVLHNDDYWLILLDRMFIDFLYQMIKISMLSFRATVHGEQGHSSRPISTISRCPRWSVTIQS